MLYSYESLLLLSFYGVVKIKLSGFAGRAEWEERSLDAKESSPRRRRRATADSGLDPELHPS